MTTKKQPSFVVSSIQYIALLVITSLLAAPTFAQPFNFAAEFPYVPMPKWKAGMRFIVATPEYSESGSTVTIRLREDPVVAERKDNLDLKKSVGKVFIYEGLKPVPNDDRDEMMAVFKKDGATYTRKLGWSKEQIERSDLGFLEGMISLDEVEKARKLLLGKTIYPIVQYGDMTAKTEPGEMVWLPKYVPVKVLKVEPGISGTPVLLTFEYPGGKQLRNIYIFSGINSMRGEPVEPTRFVKSFSLVDPRERVKDTKDAVWKSIQAGKPMKGMTMKECELTMGKPDRRLERFDKYQLVDWFYKKHHRKAWAIEFKDGVINKYATYED